MRFLPAFLIFCFFFCFSFSRAQLPPLFISLTDVEATPVDSTFDSLRVEYTVRYGGLQPASSTGDSIAFQVWMEIFDPQGAVIFPADTVDYVLIQDSVSVTYLPSASIRARSVTVNTAQVNFKDGGNIVVVWPRGERVINIDTGHVTVPYGPVRRADRIDDYKAYAYPNPAPNRCYVFAEQPIVRVEAIDLSGKKILLGLTNGTEVDLSSLSAGVYRLEGLLANGQVFRLKIVKTNGE